MKGLVILGGLPSFPAFFACFIYTITGIKLHCFSITHIDLILITFANEIYNYLCF